MLGEGTKHREQQINVHHSTVGADPAPDKTTLSGRAQNRMRKALSWNVVMSRRPRPWADKNSGFVSLIDVKHRATGRRQGGIPLLRSSFIASITPQGRLIELSRLWHRVIVQTDNTNLKAMPQGLDAWPLCLHDPRFSRASRVISS